MYMIAMVGTTKCGFLNFDRELDQQYYTVCSQRTLAYRADYQSVVEEKIRELLNGSIISSHFEDHKPEVEHNTILALSVVQVDRSNNMDRIVCTFINA